MVKALAPVRRPLFFRGEKEYTVKKKQRGKIYEDHRRASAFWPEEDGFTNLALAAGHENNAEHLEKAYEELGIVCGIVMGNRSVDPEDHRYPDFCVTALEWIAFT